MSELPVWTVDLLKLLFGNIGVLGTLLTVFAGYLAYLLQQERNDHRATRAIVQETQERRLEMHTQNITALAELKVLLDGALRKVFERGFSDGK